MRGATSPTVGSQKWPSSASSQPRRGATSESRKATKSVRQAASPVLRAAAGPLLRWWRSTSMSQCAPTKSSGSIGGNDPSSTTTTRRPRSELTSRRTPERLSRTGITTVTSWCEGPPAGRGCATVASSRVRANCALTSSRTFSRPSHSRSWAAGASFSSRVGDPPSSAEPSPSTRTRRSTWTANPSGNRGAGAVMRASRRARAATGRPGGRTRSPSRTGCARPRRRWRWSGRPARRPG